jgi:hypothetical protein
MTESDEISVDMKFIGHNTSSEHEVHHLKTLVYLRLNYSLSVTNINSERESRLVMKYLYRGSTFRFIQK